MYTPCTHYFTLSFSKIFDEFWSKRPCPSFSSFCPSFRSFSPSFSCPTVKKVLMGQCSPV